MIQMESLVQVADNTGARSAKMIGVIGKRTRQAHIGDIITCHIRESIPTASVKKGTVVKAVVVRTAAPIRRDDGSVLRFDGNAVVIIDKDNNPRGFSPTAGRNRRPGTGTSGRGIYAEPWQIRSRRGGCDGPPCCGCIF